MPEGGVVTGKEAGIIEYVQFLPGCRVKNSCDRFVPRVRHLACEGLQTGQAFRRGWPAASLDPRRADPGEMGVLPGEIWNTWGS